MKTFILLLIHFFSILVKLAGSSGTRTVIAESLMMKQQLIVERLIKSIRNEYLDDIIFWNSVDLERKLKLYQEYFNNARVHSSLGGKTPSQFGEGLIVTKADLNKFGYKSYCKEMFRIPVAA